ncbi:hypothetical protein M0R45_000289 [Rubus argutus]|uniref:Uncharacterized protein n=1 Tax=Rubus argutus TaxID=59490 RepID=A0AAW1VPT0_RUBAR
MANSPNGGNNSNGGDREREALSRAEYRDYQERTQQTLRDIQAILARLIVDPNNNRVPVRDHVHNQRQPLNEDSSSDEDYAEDMFRNMEGAGGHQRHNNHGANRDFA